MSWENGSPRPMGGGIEDASNPTSGTSRAADGRGLSFPENGESSDWKFDAIPRGPEDVQTIVDGMRRVADARMLVPEGKRFNDFAAEPVTLPTDGHGKPIAPKGICMALWWLAHGRIAVNDENGRTTASDAADTHQPCPEIWVRNDFRDGVDSPAWHSAGSALIELEFDVPRKQRTNPYWDKYMAYEALKHGMRMVRGVKFRDRAYWRDPEGRLRMSRDPADLAKPFMTTCDCDFSDALADTAESFASGLTSGPHSAENLIRMYATPMLSEYPHVAYVLRGAGGNGKGILTHVLKDSFPDLVTDDIDVEKITGGGFESSNALLGLVGKRWAIDSEAGAITPDRLKCLKKIATGDPLEARGIGENAIRFTPCATLIIDTNEEFVTTGKDDSDRRFFNVRMRDHGDVGDERYGALVGFAREHGAAPFLMASCRLWMARDTDPWADVGIGSPADLTEAEHWIADSIAEKGYAAACRCTVRHTPKEWKTAIAKLGLKSARKRIDGIVTRVLVVADQKRFDMYQDAPEPPASAGDGMSGGTAGENGSKKPDAPAAALADGPVPKPPIPFAERPVHEELGNDVMELTDFQCDYTPARDDKSAIKWKRMAADPQADTKHIPQGAAAWTVVPAKGFCVLDLDVPKEGASGWDMLNRQAGGYGTGAFPATWLVRTPHGGYHAYYKVPNGLSLKNAVHEGGVPIDIRVDGKGYVIGAGSHVAAGDYLLCDTPHEEAADGNGLAIPALSPELCHWLRDHGYTQETQPHAPASAIIVPDAHPAWRGNGRPDMTPIPEGRRNNDLHAWAYGRVANHPENWPTIKRDLYERGEKSGLPDREIAGIWKSIVARLSVPDAFPSVR